MNVVIRKGQNPRITYNCGQVSRNPNKKWRTDLLLYDGVASFHSRVQKCGIREGSFDYLRCMTYCNQISVNRVLSNIQIMDRNTLKYPIVVFMI